ncbi:hypothetical protein M9458_011472, partial [Cirrhinus mrigala]
PPAASETPPAHTHGRAAIGFKDPASLRKHLRAHQGEPGADEAMGMAGLGEGDGGSMDDEDM